LDVRYRDGSFFLITNLIFHHHIPDVFDQTTQLIRILDVVEKSLNLSLLCQWLEFPDNFFEFPKDPWSDSDLNSGGLKLTVPTSSSFLAPWNHPRKQVSRVRSKGP
jgi:hypothetical protein